MAQSAEVGRSLPTPPELSARGERVHVRTVRAEDIEPYRAAVRASAERMVRWNPVTLDDLPHRLATQSADNRTFFVLANEPVEDHPMVGRVNLFGAVRGRFRSVTMGYDAYDPYAGRGLFAEGLRLIVDLALTEAEQGGMGLHRVEANVQPRNVRSAGLLRALGFRHEGRAPHYLFLPDDSGEEQWREHERYAITREDWPAAPYAPWPSPRVTAWLSAADDPAGRDLAQRLSVELAVPVLPAGLPGLADVLAACPAGALVLGDAAGQDRPARPVAGLPVVDVPARAAAYGMSGVWDDRSVIRLALELRAGARTGT